MPITEQTIAEQTIAEITAEMTAAAGPVFYQIEWAEDEITRACARHARQADLLYHCFSLLMPNAELMGTEFVYRGHCCELLDRLAGGGDPREPTNAEVAIACSLGSLVVPPGSAFVTVYMRAWAAAFPDTKAFETLDHDSYERVAGSRADHLQADIRRRLRRPDRQVPTIDCKGLHHGEPRPDCSFAAVDMT